MKGSKIIADNHRVTKLSLVFSIPYASKSHSVNYGFQEIAKTSTKVSKLKELTTRAGPPRVEG